MRGIWCANAAVFFSFRGDEMVPSSKICLIGMYIVTMKQFVTMEVCVLYSLSLPLCLSFYSKRLFVRYFLTYIRYTHTLLVEIVAFHSCIYENEERCMPQIPINCVGPFDVHHHNGMVVLCMRIHVYMSMSMSMWCQPLIIIRAWRFWCFIPPIPFWLLDRISACGICLRVQEHFIQMNLLLVHSNSTIWTRIKYSNE